MSKMSCVRAQGGGRELGKSVSCFPLNVHFGCTFEKWKMEREKWKWQVHVEWKWREWFSPDRISWFVKTWTCNRRPWYVTDGRYDRGENALAISTPRALAISIFSFHFPFFKSAPKVHVGWN